MAPWNYVEITEHDDRLPVLNPSSELEPRKFTGLIDEVVESLVIGQRWDGDTRIVLFVRLRNEVNSIES